MSDTFVCTDTHLERPVLIKRLRPGVDPKRILDELSALQAVRSKHVVQIFDVIRDDKGNVEALVEEYLPGDEFTSAPTPSTADEFLKLIFPVAEGIADIHLHQRVHRDIKPNNMKYDGEGCLKIYDFGLSRLDDNASTGEVFGTRGYIAPELLIAGADGRTGFTAAVDTFAFGVTALRCILGQIPAALMNLPPTLPCPDADFSILPLGLPPEVASILNSCLAEDPTCRPTMVAVRDIIALHLLRDRHRALLTARTSVFQLDSSRRVVGLSAAGQGSLKVTYDGLRFVISDVSGDVSINNMPAKNGDVLPGSCVIVLGAAALASRRTFVTVDVSHPEVTI
ncbi:serine/threonine-protein kinase [Microvirga sp. M2]|uniref:serine/threonine-protein kinase n=1 Tax=Microvirga sp. M2 TaxID=3073270 RepID=UPI0039C38788